MVSTGHSTSYTDHALTSLIENTRLAPGDQVVLIDNDHSYKELPEKCRSAVRIKRNPEPLGFAANLNQAMKSAGEQQADLVFLNNDLIFSPGWFEPLRSRGPFVTCPLSNVELPCAEGPFQCGYSMDLDQYLGKERLFRELAKRHQKKYSGYLKVMSLPFFAVKIPYEVYSVVGPLDEAFGIGGGEDKDYCIRCHERGIEVRHALGSYLLHFHGRSTWRGGETRDETASRDRVYAERFRQKWGQALFDVFVFNNLKNLPEDVRLAHEKGDYRYMIERLREKNAG